MLAAHVVYPDDKGGARSNQEVSKVTFVSAGGSAEIALARVRLANSRWPSAFALFRPFFALLGGVGQIPEGERGEDGKRCFNATELIC